MKTVVNEPYVEYSVKGWLSEVKTISFDENIFAIENDSIVFCLSTGSTVFSKYEETKTKLSSLRGKMAKQSEKEIDDQISDLRNEWERNT